MPLRLACDGPIDRGIHKIVAFGGAQRRAQIGGVLLAQTHIERARARDAHAIARLAEIMGHWRDETEPAAGFLDAHVTRWSAGLIIDVFECVALSQARPYHR